MAKPTVGLPQQPMWCSVIPDRRPEQKIHKTKGHATNALSNGGPFGREGEVYQWDFDENDWVLFWKNETVRPCVKCGKTITARDLGTVEYHRSKPFRYRPNALGISQNEKGQYLKVREKKAICWDCAPIDEECPILKCDRCGEDIVVKWNGVKEPYYNNYFHIEPSDHAAIKPTMKYGL